MRDQKRSSVGVKMGSHSLNVNFRCSAPLGTGVIETAENSKQSPRENHEPQIGDEEMGSVQLIMFLETHPRISMLSIPPGRIEVLAQTATGPTPPCVRVSTGRFRSDTGFRPVVKMNPDGSEIGNSLRFQPAVVECSFAQSTWRSSNGRGEVR